MPTKEFIKNNKKIILIVIVLISFLLVGAWYGQKMKKSATLPPVAQQESTANAPAAPKNLYSRISFFLRSPVNGSLAIPEYWEGKYRTREEGNKISLNYINDPGLETNIFYVKYFTLKEWDNIVKAGQTKEKELARKDDLVYIYYIAEDNPYQGEHQAFFKNMTTEASQIIQSLKLFKSN